MGDFSQETLRRQATARKCLTHQKCDFVRDKKAVAISRKSKCVGGSIRSDISQGRSQTSSADGFSQNNVIPTETVLNQALSAAN